MRKCFKILVGSAIFMFLNCINIYASPVNGKWYFSIPDYSPRGEQGTIVMTLINGEFKWEVILIDPVYKEKMLEEPVTGTFVFKDNVVIANAQGQILEFNYDNQINILSTMSAGFPWVFRPFQGSVADIGIIPIATARELLTDFSNNEIAARRKWSNQRILFTGRIVEIFEIYGTPYLRIVDGVHREIYIHCALSPNDKLLLESRVGDTVTLDGLVGNYEGSTSFQWNYLLRMTSCVMMKIRR